MSQQTDRRQAGTIGLMTALALAVFVSALPAAAEDGPADLRAEMAELRAELAEVQALLKSAKAEMAHFRSKELDASQTAKFEQWKQERDAASAQQKAANQAEYKLEAARGSLRRAVRTESEKLEQGKQSTGTATASSNAPAQYAAPPAYADRYGRGGPNTAYGGYYAGSGYYPAGRFGVPSYNYGYGYGIRYGNYYGYRGGYLRGVGYPYGRTYTTYRNYNPQTHTYSYPYRTGHGHGGVYNDTHPPYPSGNSIQFGYDSKSVKLNVKIGSSSHNLRQVPMSIVR
jgi:hypothetical protein